MLQKLLFPWESHVMITTPLAMPIFMLLFSVGLSIITWVRQSKKDKNK